MRRHAPPGPPILRPFSTVVTLGDPARGIMGSAGDRPSKGDVVIEARPVSADPEASTLPLVHGPTGGGGSWPTTCLAHLHPR